VTPAEYQIVLVKPASFGPIEPFREVMESVQHGLQAHGYSALIRENTIAPGATPILFGAHYLSANDSLRLPPDTIIYNLEQLAPGYPWFQTYYLDLLGRFRVWDYNARTVTYLRTTGIARNVEHVPIGYAPCWTRIAKAPVEDVDVLFYGISTPRRLHILQALGNAGLNVVALNSVWGGERDKWIARSKVVLNMHQAVTGQFESVRVMFLLANRKAVVCECENPEEVDANLRSGLELAKYPDIVERCLSLVRDDKSRHRIVEAGFSAVTIQEMQIERILNEHLTNANEQNLQATPKTDAAPPSPFIFSPDFENFISALLDKRSYSAACDHLSGLVQKIAADSQFIGNRIYLPGMDRLLYRLGKELLQDRLTESDGRGKGIPVIVATELYIEGGHTRIIEELVAIHGDALIILTNYFGGSNRPSNVLPPAICDLPIMVLPEDTAANNIVRLNRLCKQVASHIYLLPHHHDVVANAALSHSMRVPVFFIHHSDHKASLGATMESFVHVDLVPHMHALCTKFLNRKVEYWPQGVKDRGAKHFAYPLSDVSSSSSGTSVKFAWEGPLAYPKLVRHLLASGIAHHFHIGELPTCAREQIEKELFEHSIPIERFQCLGRVRSVWQCLLELPVHLFIGSAPIHGLRTAIEVQGAGVPIIPFLQNPDNLLHEDTFYNDATEYWQSPEDIGSIVQRVLDKHHVASRSARLHYEAHFSPELMRQEIERAVSKYGTR
jgi:hypothetical protein